MPSLYGFAKEQDATNINKVCWWVAPYFLFAYYELGTTNSPQQMAKQHTTTLRFKAHSMGKLINVIWGEDWDVESFIDNSIVMSFGKMIYDMYNPNLEA
jgi:hypothetical protein